MPFRCCVVNCRGNYDLKDPCQVFRLPRNQEEREKWLMRIPSYQSGKVKLENFRVCEKHWPETTPMIAAQADKLRPATPPSIFNVPPSCLPTAKPQPRKPKDEFALLSIFDKRDKISCFASFSPEKELQKKYHNVYCTRTEEELVCFFVNRESTAVDLLIKVNKSSSLCSNMKFTAHKRGVKVHIPRNILNPNNGLVRYSQFFEAVNGAVQQEITDKVYLQQAADNINIVQERNADPSKGKKI